MRARTALCVATVAMFLSAGWAGNCFAGSGLAGAPKEERAAVTGAVRNEPAAGVVHEFTDQVDIQADAAGVDDGGNARMEDAGPAPTEKRPGQHSTSHVGIGVKISTLGAGIETAVPLAAKANLRGGVNFFQYNRAIINDGIHYAGQLQFRSAEAHFDFYPFGGFHVSPGVLFYNGNQLTASASVPGGQNFTLNGTAYQSSMTTPVTGTGKLDFVKVSPSIMLGFGNLIPRSGRHYSFLFEVGGAYQGSARVALNLAGSVCDTATGTICTSTSDPTVQANVLAQQQKIRNDVNPYRFFPVVSLGVGFNF
jgi:hypothetical protein